MALPFNDITTDLVAQTLGLNSHDIGELCSGRLVGEPASACRINIWSKYKPINSTVFPHTQEMRDMDFGFNITPVQSGVPGIIYYDLPKEADDAYFCLDDYSGYNHAAVPCTARIQDTHFVGAPAGTNIYIGSNDSSASFSVYVVLPEFDITRIKYGNYKTITVTDGKAGTPEFNELVGSYTIQPGEVGRQITVPCTQSKNLPGKGGQSIRNYYVTFGGAYWLNTDYMRLTGMIYRQMIVDVNDPAQWSGISMYDPDNLLLEGGLSYESWQYFYGDGKLPDTRVRIRKLVIPSSVGDVGVYYKYNDVYILYATYRATTKDYLEFVLTGKSHVSNWKIERKF